MNFLNELMFTRIPMIALLCNVFLLFTLLSAKKDASIRAFMGLLTSFILWAAGAYLMRRQIYPGVAFWWKVSLTGIFMVPYMYFLLVFAYTEQKGFFLQIIWGIGTSILVILNLFDVFMTSPVITMVDGELVSRYSVKWPAIFPVVFTIGIFLCIWRIIRKTLREERMRMSYITPLLVGVGIMLIGITINTIFTTLPTDTLSCAINSVCIYYAFYKKRFYALDQIASKGSMYVVSLVLTGTVLTSIYKSAEDFMSQKQFGSEMNVTLIITVVCSAFAILIFLMLNRLHDGLFVREQVRRENRVHDFSVAVNSTLKTDEILQRFLDLVQEEIPIDHVYICMYSEETGEYHSNVNIQSLEHPLRFREDHPLVKKLQTTKNGVVYADFQKTTAYKSMWEKEKKQLSAIQASYILPFRGDGRIIGFVIFSEKQTKKLYSYAEINFLESVVSVASIALKNASLYYEIEKEALLDPLTGLLNRKTLIKRMDQLFGKKASPITLVLLNLDDFSLYNELYGSEEGDKMLEAFARILKSVFGLDAIISRYGGKEFAVVLPYCNPLTARHKTEKVQEKLASYIENSNSRIKKFLTFSSGICTYPAVAANANQLLSYANMAVFHVKQHGKNNIEIYNEQNFAQEKAEEGIHELTSTIYALTAAIDAKDHYTFNHSQCVSKYAAKLAEEAGLSAEHVEIVRQAGLLHDIGKIGIPDAILTKKGRLTPEEFSIMRLHVERSIEMIRHLPSLDYVIPAVLGHHERYDGKGYPRGIAGEDIPISARCLSIADSFDAMISKRSYKDRMPLESAVAEIENNLGTQFDPQLGELFVKMLEEGRIEVVYY